jgi:hypothetical protein
MANPNRSFRVSKLNTAHATALSVLTSTGQTLATIAGLIGTSVDDAEKKLSVLVDEGLCNRTRGTRPVAVYTVA